MTNNSSKKHRLTLGKRLLVGLFLLVPALMFGGHFTLLSTQLRAALSSEGLTPLADVAVNEEATK
jgi:hypothetical protein